MLKTKNLFKLYSQFKPTGDQPQAIKKLTKNLRADARDNVLLGVTGSGKSVTGDTPVFVKQNGNIKNCQIGPLIDNIFQKYSKKTGKTKETEILAANQIRKKDRMDAFSLNPKTKKGEWKPITQFIRHPSPKHLFHIKTTCGREITVTGDHNFFVLRDGKFVLLPTNEVKNTDYIPLPLEIPGPEKDLSHLNLLEILKEEKLFVDAKPFILKALSEKRPLEVAHVMKDCFVFPRQKLYQIKSGRYRGMPLSAISQVAQTLNIDFSSEDVNRVVVGSQLHHYTLPGKVPLSKDWLKLIGYYIAEGHGEPGSGFVTITASHSVVQKELQNLFRKLELNFHRKKYNKNDFSVSSKIHTILLAKLLGINARSKKLPEFWPNLSQKQLSVLLRAYFTGDGGAFLERREIVAPTASKQLASDIGYALLRFGIWARVRRVWGKATNSPKHKGNYYWYINFSGRENIARFKKYIGFNIPEKQKRLEELLKQSTHATNVDVIPKIGPVIKNTRKQLEIIPQRTFAETFRMPVGTLNAVEIGINNPRRKTFKKIIDGFVSLSKTGKEVNELKSLLNCRWLKIAEIKKITSKDVYIYDFGVKNNETFLAGRGGMFIHNTFTMAKVIENIQKPILVIVMNKTLAAQLYQEFKGFFPENAIHFFTSYYDYYQPEAYIPQTDTYIEKETEINDEIDKLRHAATTALLTRRDVIIVASVSCIYGLGSPQEYKNQAVRLKLNLKMNRNDVLRELTRIQYARNDTDFRRGTFRVRGDTLEINPASEDRKIARIEFFGDTIEKISWVERLTGKPQEKVKEIEIFPARHWITPVQGMDNFFQEVKKELAERIRYFKKQKKPLEAERIEQRTRYDLEMIAEVGYCTGIENYSRYLEGRLPGEPPSTLIDFFPKDYLLFVDESHMTVPQIRGMYFGDRARKKQLIEFGFRLPSALDNRPLQFGEFESKINQVIFVSATPGPYETKKSEAVVEQLIRPTGLVDPEVAVRTTQNQIDDLLNEIQKRIAKKQRVLVTTLTKRMAEELSSYLQDAGLKVHYLHSEIDTLERLEILKKLRQGVFDIVVGINLLREGLDLPEVSLVAILDADKEGYLRSKTALIQTMGRAARHIEGKAIMYADTITSSMQKAISEVKRRRKIQMAYNKKHNITPRSIKKRIKDFLPVQKEKEAIPDIKKIPGEDRRFIIKELQEEMEIAAKNLEFEKAARLRDQIKQLKSS